MKHNFTDLRLILLFNSYIYYYHVGSHVSFIQSVNLYNLLLYSCPEAL